MIRQTCKDRTKLIMQALKNRIQGTEKLSASKILSFSYVVFEALPVVVYFSY
jgi:hypothetical protein